MAAPYSTTTRGRAAEAIAHAAAAFPRFDPHPLDVAGLTARDAGLAVAIQRVTLQRWLTLEYLLDRHLSQPAAKLEPRLRAVLLTAAAQILFFDRLPAHAVVDESVELARRMVRPKAAGLTNAVLRKLSDLVMPGAGDLKSPRPAANALPMEQGAVLLRQACLPCPTDFVNHWSIATSHPHRLVQVWLDELGADETMAACLHGIAAPPLFVHTPEASHPLLWTESHEALRQYLAGDVRRRVQDPTAALAVAATADVQPGIVIDFCAGRGTKTRQLLALHPQARIFAYDADADRRADLTRDLAGHVTIAAPSALPGDADLLVLDVPCSNTGVLGRRPEARYRFSAASVQSVVALQRRIIAEAIPLLRPGGHVLYSTCSINRAENQEQVAHIVKHHRGEMVAEQLTLPGGHGADYHDGGYYARIRRQ